MKLVLILSHRSDNSCVSDMNPEPSQSESQINQSEVSGTESQARHDEAASPISGTTPDDSLQTDDETVTGKYCRIIPV